LVVAAIAALVACFLAFGEVQAGVGYGVSSTCGCFSSYGGTYIAPGNRPPSYSVYGIQVAAYSYRDVYANYNWEGRRQPGCQPEDEGYGLEDPLKADEGMLTIRVPNDARLYVNGLLTRTSGMSRTYVTKGLEPGSRYKYKVRAELNRDGEMIEETKIVYLEAGESESISLNLVDTRSE